MSEDERNIEERVIILSPTGKDASLIHHTLAQAGIGSVTCSHLEHVCGHLDTGAGALIVSEEAISQAQHNLLSDWLRHQPPWSDMPILILSRTGADSNVVKQAVRQWGNVTVLERPLRLAAFVSAVQTALRARQRQYEIRRHLAAHIEAENSLRETDARKDEFLATLAHELRNPLAPIRNSIGILKLQSGREAGTTQVVDIMERQVNMMVRLVDDLMEVSRLSRGIISLDKSPLNIAAVVEDAVEISRTLVEEANHELTLTFPEEPVVVMGDRVRLAQVLANLLNNAAKYTKPGGKIWITVQAEADQAVIRVKDTGQGIPVEMLTSIFDIFRQVNSFPAERTGGLGIGLTLVKRLVEMHGGNVVAHSKGLDTGSEFTVRLPRSIGSAIQSGDNQNDATEDPIQCRVLIIDDNHDAAISLDALLKLLGAEVNTVFTGADAIKTLETYHPDIVFLDIGMPGMDGYEVARWIRARPRFEKVILIALTGWGQESDQLRSCEAGFDHHINKPAEIGILKKMLASTRH